MIKEGGINKEFSTVKVYKFTNFVKSVVSVSNDEPCIIVTLCYTPVLDTFIFKCERDHMSLFSQI